MRSAHCGSIARGSPRGLCPRPRRIAPAPRLRPGLAAPLLWLLWGPAAWAQRAPEPRLPEPPTVTPEGRIVQRPDLSQLPEVDDRAPRPRRVSMAPRLPPGAPTEPTAPILGPPAIDPLGGRSYLGPLGEPRVDFVPDSPSGVTNARPLWDAMLSPPSPPPEVPQGRPLRIAAFSLFGVGGAALVVSLGLLGAQDPGPARLGSGYAILGTSLLSAAAGGVLLTLGKRRDRLARGEPP